jgi:hypothetical protein
MITPQIQVETIADAKKSATECRWDVKSESSETDSDKSEQNPISVSRLQDSPTKVSVSYLKAVDGEKKQIPASTTEIFKRLNIKTTTPEKERQLAEFVNKTSAGRPCLSGIFSMFEKLQNDSFIEISFEEFFAAAKPLFAIEVQAHHKLPERIRKAFDALATTASKDTLEPSSKREIKQYYFTLSEEDIRLKIEQDDTMEQEIKDKIHIEKFFETQYRPSNPHPDDATKFFARVVMSSIIVVSFDGDQDDDDFDFHHFCASMTKDQGRIVDCTPEKFIESIWEAIQSLQMRPDIVFGNRQDVRHHMMQIKDEMIPNLFSQNAWDALQRMSRQDFRILEECEQGHDCENIDCVSIHKNFTFEICHDVVDKIKTHLQMPRQPSAREQLHLPAKMPAKMPAKINPRQKEPPAFCLPATVAKTVKPDRPCRWGTKCTSYHCDREHFETEETLCPYENCRDGEEDKYGRYFECPFMHKTSHY